MDETIFQRLTSEPENREEAEADRAFLEGTQWSEVVHNYSNNTSVATGTVYVTNDDHATVTYFDENRWTGTGTGGEWR